MEDSEIKQNVSPYFMARIIDVQKFLERYPFASSNFLFRLAITDSLLEWNHGTFEITVQSGEVTVEKVCNELESNAVQMTVQTFVTMFLGYKRPTYLHSIERLKGDTASVVLLESILPNAVPSFIDYF